MKIVFDLDGVLRDLAGYVAKKNGCSYPKVWNEKYKGLDIFQCIDKDLDCLINARPTAYLPIVVKYYREIDIWTNQPDNWKSHTEKWIDNNVATKVNIYYKSPDEKARCLLENRDIILVEDSPKFYNYDQILLIDRPYNQHVKAVMRVFGPKHLNNLLEIAKAKENK